MIEEDIAYIKAIERDIAQGKESPNIKAIKKDYEDFVKKYDSVLKRLAKS